MAALFIPGPSLKQPSVLSTSLSAFYRAGSVLTCLLAFQCTLDPDTFEPTDTLTEQAVEFCQRVGSKASTVSEIVGQHDEAVYQAIEEGIQRVNANAAARPYHIQKWAILERDFSISGGELGRFHCPRGCGKQRPHSARQEPTRKQSQLVKVWDRPLDSSHISSCGRTLTTGNVVLWLYRAWRMYSRACVPVGFRQVDETNYTWETFGEKMLLLY